jgi:hypothetical protein
MTVDVSSRASIRRLVEGAMALGDVTGVIHAAGVSPSQASPATILAVDLYGTAPSSPEAIFSWTAGSPPLTGSAISPRSDGGLMTIVLGSGVPIAVPLPRPCTHPRTPTAPQGTRRDRPPP